MIEAEDLSVWDETLLVREGYLTSKDATIYLDLFYQELQPLTPVVVADYRHSSCHRELLENEPFLAYAILAISAKFTSARESSKVLSGTTWRFCLAILHHIVEQDRRCRSVDHLPSIKHCCNPTTMSNDRLQCLGTVEALLLLAIWQPGSFDERPGTEKVGEQDEGQRATYQVKRDGESLQLLELAWNMSLRLGVFDECATKSCPDSITKQESRRMHRLARLINFLLADLAHRSGMPPTTDLQPHVCHNSLHVKDWVDEMHDKWLELLLIAQEIGRLSKDDDLNGNRGEGSPFDAVLLLASLDVWECEFRTQRLLYDEVMEDLLMLEYKYLRLQLCNASLKMYSISLDDDPEGPAHRNHCFGNRRTATGVDQLHRLVAQDVLRKSPVRVVWRCLSYLQISTWAWQSQLKLDHMEVHLEVDQTKGALPSICDFFGNQSPRSANGSTDKISPQAWGVHLIEELSCRFRSRFSDFIKRLKFDGIAPDTNQCFPLNATTGVSLSMLLKDQTSFIASDEQDTDNPPSKIDQLELTKIAASYSKTNLSTSFDEDLQFFIDNLV